MESLLQQLDHWHWWIAAVLLMILELTAPAVFFLWMGIAAGITGLLLYLDPALDWKSQVLWFSGLSVAAIAVWHGVLKKSPTKTDLPTLNRRGSQYVGRTFTLAAAVENGRGKIRVDDTVWQVTGPDLAAGGKVRVVAAEGTLLRVEPEDYA